MTDNNVADHTEFAHAIMAADEVLDEVMAIAQDRDVACGLHLQMAAHRLETEAWDTADPGQSEDVRHEVAALNAACRAIALLAEIEIENVHALADILPRALEMYGSFSAESDA